MAVIFIDPGHGGKDPGALGFGSQEKVTALEIAKLVGKYLTERYIVEVVYTRNSDMYLTLDERADLANEAKATAFYSFHHNGGVPTARGYEDFIHSNLDEHSPTSRMRDVIHAEVQDVLEKYKIPNRGKKKANFSVLRETKMPAVLFELLFISNESDHKLITNSTFKNDIAQAIAIGIARANGLTVKPKPKVVVATNKSVGLTRVIVNGAQVGAFGEEDNILAAVKDHLEKAKQITLEKV